MKMKVYHYPGCSTCKKALAFLRSSKIDFLAINIVESPPTVDELSKMADALNGEVKKLFNVSGEMYRELKLKDRIATTPKAELLKLLAANGKLVKRPFVIGKNVQLVGFREDEWQIALEHLGK